MKYEWLKLLTTWVLKLVIFALLWIFLWQCYISALIVFFEGPLDVESSLLRRGSRQNYLILRKALCVGYGNQLAERMLHHNGYRTLGYRSQLVQVSIICLQSQFDSFHHTQCIFFSLQVHPSSVLQTDEDGWMPDYVVYHELVSTPRPFMRNVCAVNMTWAVPILNKLDKLNINMLRYKTLQNPKSTLNLM